MIIQVWFLSYLFVECYVLLPVFWSGVAFRKKYIITLSQALYIFIYIHVTSAFLASYARRSSGVAMAERPRRFSLAIHSPLRLSVWRLIFWYNCLACVKVNE